jgi:histidine kinase
MLRASLSLKLLISFVLVVVISSVAAFGVASWLGPQLFDEEVELIGQRLGWVDGQPPGSGSGTSGSGFGQGSGGGQGRGPDSAAHQEAVDIQQQALDQELSDAFSGALTAALLVALGLGLAAAFIAAVLVARRLLRPLDRIRGSVRDLASGARVEAVPEPPDRELAALAGDVNALGRSLAETEERRTQLVSDLSHELRTPITALDGFLEGLEDGVFEPDADTLAAMRHETRRLERLAVDLGAVSRASEQAFDLQWSDVDLSSVAERASRAMIGAFSAGGVELRIDPMPDLPIRGDADRLGQVCTNLLRNALQHSNAGDVVTVSGSSADDRALLHIADTGSGIAPKDLDRVFDRFVRVGDGDSSGGSGIGLTIARGIAEAHGGSLVAFSSGPGTGATFTLDLPLREQVDD